MKKTHYEILGVSPNSTQSEIRAAYHQKLLHTHPDKVGQNSFKLDLGISVSELKSAYSILGDAEGRKLYDEELKASFKSQGFNISGAGLDTITLAAFTECYNPQKGMYHWIKDCPRCTARDSILLTEDDLEKGSPDGSGGFQIVAPCQACSLWIAVSYEEDVEEE